MVALQMTLTPRQQEVLSFIEQYTTTQGYPPSRSDIGRAMGFTVNGAEYYVRLLAKKGAIERIPNIARGIRIKT